MSWYHIICMEHRTKSWTVSFSEDALATLSTERQQASTSYWGEHPLPLTKRTGIQVQGLWPKFPFVCLPLHQGLVFPGWRWDLFCTRNDCAAQLQRRKPCQVSFGRFAWNWTEFEDFFPTQGTEWTSIAGRLDFSAQLRHMQRCRQQLDKFHWVSSSLSTKWGLSILWRYYCRPITFVLDLISFATGMWWRRVIL